MQEIVFTVLGAPQGKGRPRFTTYGGHAHAITPQNTVLYENLIITEYRRQIGSFRFDDYDIIQMVIFAYYPIPKSTSKKKRQDMLAGILRPIKKPDMDNVMKVYADALNGIAYRDDTQIVDAYIKKLYSETPRVKVVLRKAAREDETDGSY